MYNNVVSRSMQMQADRSAAQMLKNGIQQIGDIVASAYAGTAGHVAASAVNTGWNMLSNKLR